LANTGVNSVLEFGFYQAKTSWKTLRKKGANRLGVSVEGSLLEFRFSDSHLTTRTVREALHISLRKLAPHARLFLSFFKVRFFRASSDSNKSRFKAVFKK